MNEKNQSHFAFDISLEHAEGEIEKLYSMGILERNVDDLFNDVLTNFNDLDSSIKSDISVLKKHSDQATVKLINDSIKRDGVFTLTIAEDHLSAYLSVTLPEGNGAFVSEQDIIFQIQALGITTGIDLPKIQSLMQTYGLNSHEIHDELIAEGTPPVSGTDGTVEFLVECPLNPWNQCGDSATAPRDTCNGGSSAKPYRKFYYVSKEQLIAFITPPQPGTPGISIFGEPIPAVPGNSTKLAIGANILFDEEQGAYSSQIDGCIIQNNGVLDVTAVYVVDGDIDMSTGNIDYQGSVIVKGTVREGFTLKADSDIEVFGSIEGAIVTTLNGSITVHNGIAGMGKCHVSSATDLKAKYIENGNVFARKSIHIEDAILHSIVHAGEAVLVNLGKGKIAGGSIYAGKLIEAKTLGAPCEPKTHLVIGLSSEQQVKLQEIMLKINTASMVLGKVKNLISQYSGQNFNVCNISEEHKERLLNLQRRSIVLQFAIGSLAKEKGNIESQPLNCESGSLHVYNEVFSNVHLHMGSQTLHLPFKHKSSKYEYDLNNEKIISR